MGFTEEEECTANAASRFIHISYYFPHQRGGESKAKAVKNPDFWMHSINTNVSVHSRLDSGLVFSGDNSKKLSRHYMDYLVEWSFISS